jgi:hypothetical protein
MAEKPVFQVNLGLSYEIICCDSVPVHDGDGEGMIKGKRSWKLKHFAKYWIEIAGDVSISVVDCFLPNADLDVRVRFAVWISRMEVYAL